MELSKQDLDLLNALQKDFPLHSQPFQVLSDQLGIPEQDIIDRLKTFKDNNAISRFGAIFDHQRAGASTLAALSIPADKINKVAKFVSGFEAVNHNYERDHTYNLWFVVNGPDQIAVDQVLAEITEQFNYPLLNLPMIKNYHIDLGFPLW